MADIQGTGDPRSDGVASTPAVSSVMHREDAGLRGGPHGADVVSAAVTGPAGG